MFSVHSVNVVNEGVPTLTVEENINAILETLPLSRPERKRRLVSLLEELVGRLNGRLLAQAVDKGDQHMLEGIFASLSGRQIAESLSNHGGKFLQDMMSHNYQMAPVIADAIKYSVTEPNSLLRNLAVNARERTLVPDLNIPLELNVWAWITGGYAGPQSPVPPP